MTLHDAIATSGIGLRVLSTLTQISKSALHRLVRFGEYPARREPDDTRRVIAAALARHGYAGEIDWPRPGCRPGSQGNHYNCPKTRPSNPLVEELKLMQISREVLAYFGLRTNPFMNEIQHDSDVYTHRGHIEVLEAIRDAIEERSLLALVGPTGAGKTTLWETIESEYLHAPDVIICKPMAMHKEKITPDHLVRALIIGIHGGYETQIKQNSESRGRQLAQALASTKMPGGAEKRVILYLDDAHFCNRSTLRQLKTFYEQKAGRYRLLSIILVGLPELLQKLSAFPEVGNRCTIIEAPKVPVREYLEHKFAKAGSKLDRIFDPGGLDAFLARFRVARRQPMAYPIEINQLCRFALRERFRANQGPGEKITQAIIDKLPALTAQMLEDAA